MLYRYYMTQRPPMPGAMPQKDLFLIEDLDQRDVIPYLGKGAYAMIAYTRPLTDKEIKEYELVPEDNGSHPTEWYKGYVIEWIPQEEKWRVYDEAYPQYTVAYVDSVEEAKQGIDSL